MAFQLTSGILLFGLVPVLLAVDVCLDNFGAKSLCDTYAPSYCDNSILIQHCRVTCKLCVPPAPTPSHKSIKGSCLEAFNAKRRLHQNTPDLVWNGVAEAEAQAIADTITYETGINFGSHNFYGRTAYTYTYTGEKTIKDICEVAAKTWYESGSEYDYENPVNGGLFTQLIWKSTTSLGIGVVIRERDGWNYAYLIAHFYVPGNYDEQYVQNIMPLKSMPPKQTTTTTTTTTTRAPTVLPNNVGSSGGSGGNYEQKCLPIHNEKRALHRNTDPMVYDTAIEASAQVYANYLAENDVFEHDLENKHYGENLYVYSSYPTLPQENIDSACVDATNAWYEEINAYDYNDPKFSPGTGHFTQVVWKTTRKLGVGIAHTKNKVYVVARYDPKGNFDKEFAENVDLLK